MTLKHFGHSHGFFQIIYLREKCKYWRLKFSLPFFIYKIPFFFNWTFSNVPDHRKLLHFVYFFFHFNCMTFYSTFWFSENLDRLYFNQECFYLFGIAIQPKMFLVLNIASVLSKYALQNKIHSFLDFGRQNIQLNLQYFLVF